jgi:hypothetical protein
MLALLMAVGAFAGVIAGLLGVGGGIILVPAFFYVFSALGYGSDQLMQICLATSLATIIVTSLGEVAQHVVQHAAVLDVFDLDLGIDPAFQRDRLLGAVGVGDRAGHLGQRLEVAVEAGDRDSSSPVRPATCGCRRR